MAGETPAFLQKNHLLPCKDTTINYSLLGTSKNTFCKIIVPLVPIVPNVPKVFRTGTLGTNGTLGTGILQ
jgi:hypothetical protein